MWSTQKIEKVQTDVILTASALFLFCTGVLVLHEKCTRFSQSHACHFVVYIIIAYSNLLWWTHPEVEC